eukprot:365894-Chlamydomonas_euryale.AAC.1
MWQPRKHSFAGGVAGGTAVLALHPFDVIKTRLQGAGSQARVVHGGIGSADRGSAARQHGWCGRHTRSAARATCIEEGAGPRGRHGNKRRGWHAASVA